MPNTTKRTRRKPTTPVVVKRQGINALQPELKAAVMRLAKGDATRVEVVSSTEAIVRNK